MFPTFLKLISQKFELTGTDLYRSGLSKDIPNYLPLTMTMSQDGLSETNVLPSVCRVVDQRLLFSVVK